MSTPFLAELRIMSFNYAPRGWALANGQLLPINQNQALFSLLGTTFGGNGQTTFGLPNLLGRVPVCQGSGFTLGQQGGEYNHTLIMGEMAQHNHVMMAKNGNANTAPPGPADSVAIGHSTATGQPAVSIFGTGAVNRTFAPSAISATGGSQAHSNTQPYLCLSVCIALQGAFPSQN